MTFSDVKPGDILTVRVEIYKEHVPAQVVVMRVRSDLTWNDVLANYKAQVSSKADVSGTHLFAVICSLCMRYVSAWCSSDVTYDVALSF